MSASLSGPTYVQAVAYTLLLDRLQRLLGCSTEDTLSRVTVALGCNPSLEDLRRAYTRVTAGGAL